MCLHLKFRRSLSLNTWWQVGGQSAQCSLYGPHLHLALHWGLAKQFFCLYGNKMSLDPECVDAFLSVFLDPFGGDPFKENDPFKGTSSEDFFRKTDRKDPFGSSDPFGRKPPPPAKVSASFLTQPSFSPLRAGFADDGFTQCHSDTSVTFPTTLLRSPVVSQFPFRQNSTLTCWNLLWSLPAGKLSRGLCGSKSTSAVAPVIAGKTGNDAHEHKRWTFTC